MKGLMKRFIKCALAAALLFAICVPAWSEQQPIDRRQYRKNLAYNKNAVPAGWQYEAGYAMWRMNRKLPVNLNTYRKYKKDRAWHNRMRNYYRPQQLALNTADWTVEELALFFQQHQDYLRFHPAGYTD
jgi:hypothetical protein